MARRRDPRSRNGLTARRSTGLQPLRSRPFFLQEDRKFGCPDCYEVFREDLSHLFRKIHGSDIHRGARPRNACGDVVSPEGLGSLRKELQEAVEKEEYERAAVIRDRIREIEECHEGEG